MSYSKKDIEFLQKSIYKAVMKGLKDKKAIIEDVMDDNFEAEFEAEAPATKLSTMNKEEKGVEKLKKFNKKIEKKKNRCWEGYEPVPGKKPYSEDSCRKK